MSSNISKSQNTPDDDVLPEETVAEERILDATLRPGTFDDYVGQENIKENLRIILGAASKRKEPPEHLLFYGPAGLGKTTLAHLIAKETGGAMKPTSGPAIEKVGDLASILTNLTPGDVLFIDEIHRLNKSIEEVLYPAMESGVLHIIIGKGPSARTIELALPAFTLVAATTRIAMLSAPLRSRFSGGTFRLEFYTEEEIGRIIKRSANILGISLDKEAGIEIARRSRRTPRIANYLLKRVRDYGSMKGKKADKKTVVDALTLLGIDERGLSPSDREFLTVMIEKFGSRPVGINTLAAALSEDPATIEEVYEPYLLQIGFLERTPKGRIPTVDACKHLKLDSPTLL